LKPSEGSDNRIFDILGVNVSTAGGGIKGGGRIDISNLSPGIYRNPKSFVRYYFM
jgi:hypothetical protein